MTIHAPATHTLNHQTSEHLLKALAVVTEADLGGILTQARQAQGTAVPAQRRGPRAQYVPYTAIALVCAMYELKASGRGSSLKEILDALWFRYTEAELALIGMEGLRDPARLAAMTLEDTSMSPAEKRTATTKAQRVYEAEYQRLVVAFDRIFDPIDDTPPQGQPPTRPQRRDQGQEAHHRPGRPRSTTSSAKAEACRETPGGQRHHRRQPPGREPRTPPPRRRLHRHPGRLPGPRRDRRDPHHRRLWRPAQGCRSGQLPQPHPRPHRDGGSKGVRAAVGLTLGLTAADPSQDHNVPELCLGASIHHPTGGLGDAVRDVLDAVESNGLRKPRGSNDTQYWVFDGGYTENKGLNVDLTNAGLGMVMKYSKTRRVLFEVGAVNNADGTKADGVYLFNGVPLCPGAARRRLEELAQDFKKPEEARMSDEQLLTHAEVVAELEPLRMRTNGRPQLVPLRKRGGQSKTATDKEPEKVMKVTVTCPMVAGTARCPLFAEFNDPAYAHLPEVPDAPVHLDPEQRPACCRNANGNMSLNVPLDAFKTWQDFMVGSFEHSDWYTGPRSNDERYNSLLKRAHGGTDLSRRSIAPRKAPFYALTLAVSIAVTNRRALQTFEAKISARGGTKPAPPGKKNKVDREARLKNARESRRKPRAA